MHDGADRRFARPDFQPRDRPFAPSVGPLPGEGALDKLHTKYTYWVCMAVRDALLALLATGSRHGYQLRAEFDAATGGAWPLNVGQVYTTLQRLERDGLVTAAGDPDDDGRVPYHLTDDGRAELDRWFARPAEHAMAPRDELPMKVMLAAATGAMPVLDLVSNERRVAMATLQDLTALKSQPDMDLARRLQVDRMVLRTEAEIRWLDLVEERFRADGVTSTVQRVTARAEPDPDVRPEQKEAR